MSKAKFSGATGGIYPINVFVDFPEDAIDIPQPLYDDYLAGRIAGFVLVDGEVVELQEFVSIADLKLRKNAEIDRAWAAASMSQFNHGDYVVGCDQIDRMNIDGVAGNIKLLGGFPANFPGMWKARDAAGEVAYIPMAEIAQFCSMYADMTAQGSANFTHAQELKAELAAATTKEQIDAITW